MEFELRPHAPSSECKDFRFRPELLHVVVLVPTLRPVLSPCLFSQTLLPEVYLWLSDSFRCSLQVCNV